MENSSLGLILRKHSLLYGHNHGRFRWLPGPIKYPIVHIFNWITCRLLGHEILGPLLFNDGYIYQPTCTSCCKKFPEVGIDYFNEEN
jgi:hypothetical protein